MANSDFPSHHIRMLASSELGKTAGAFSGRYPVLHVLEDRQNEAISLVDRDGGFLSVDLIEGLADYISSLDESVSSRQWN